MEKKFVSIREPEDSERWKASVDRIIKENDIMQMYMFAIELPTVPVGRIIEAMLNYELGRMSPQLYGIILGSFAHDVKEAPVDRFAEKVYELKEPVSIIKFAESIKDAPIEKFADFIIDYGDEGYIYDFASRVKNAPVDKLADAIIAKKNTDFIRAFAYNVEGAPVAKLLLALKDSEKKELPKGWVNKFADDFEDEFEEG